MDYDHCVFYATSDAVFFHSVILIARFENEARCGVLYVQLRMPEIFTRTAARANAICLCAYCCVVNWCWLACKFCTLEQQPAAATATTTNTIEHYHTKPNTQSHQQQPTNSHYNI